MPEKAGEPSTGFLGALGTFRNHSTHGLQIFARGPLAKVSRHQKKRLLEALSVSMIQKADSASILA
jgi:hypothetical protein